jgi:putative FmdB family regulatory protein
MPLLEYHCQDCDKTFEVFTRQRELSNAPKCPECGRTSVERVLSPFSGKTSRRGGCSASPVGFG